MEMEWPDHVHLLLLLQSWQYIDTNPQNRHKDCFYKEPPP